MFSFTAALTLWPAPTLIGDGGGCRHVSSSPPTRGRGSHFPSYLRSGSEPAPSGNFPGWREPLRLYTAPPTGASTFSNWWIQAGRADPLASIQDITEGPSAPELPTILRPFLSFSTVVQPLWSCTPWWSYSQNIPHADLCLRVCVLGNLIYKWKNIYGRSKRQINDQWKINYFWLSKINMIKLSKMKAHLHPWLNSVIVRLFDLNEEGSKEDRFFASKQICYCFPPLAPS